MAGDGVLEGVISTLVLAPSRSGRGVYPAVSPLRDRRLERASPSFLRSSMPQSLLSTRASRVCLIVSKYSRVKGECQMAHLFQTQPGSQRRRKQKEGADKIWQCVGEVDEKTRLAEQVWIASCRICEDSSKYWPNDDTDIECHGKQEECPRLYRQWDSVMIILRDVLEYRLSRK